MLITAAAMGLLPAGRAAGADFSAWTDTVEVRINTAADGAGVSGTTTRFPLLVRLDAESFDFARARGRGEDVRFATVSGTPLPHEIERWDSAAARAEIWVLVDTVKGDNASQRVMMYAGNPAAADSSNPGATFPASRGLVGVWHLGAPGAAARTNAVPGGAPAATANYDGDESRPGIIGYCDSLDGGSPGDHLDIGDGYADFTVGFTYSAWIRPTAVRPGSHFIDLGNAVDGGNRGIDNIIVGREDATGNLVVENWLPGGVASSFSVDGALSENRWQHIAVTITTGDSSLRIYKDGAVIGDFRLEGRLSQATRVLNWLGRSGWASDEYFQGEFDEVRVSRVPHSAHWIKLSYENQRPDQRLVTLYSRKVCRAEFSVPAGATVDEGQGVALSAAVECAVRFGWSRVSGPGPVLRDPEVRDLFFYAPRVSGNTDIVLKFGADFGDSVREAEVRVTVREAIPEPVLVVPGPQVWNGTDSLELIATVANLADIKASRDSALTWTWTLEGIEADTAWRNGRILLRSPSYMGEGNVTVCVHNGGASACMSVKVSVGTTVSARRPGAAAREQSTPAVRSVDGRWMPDARGPRNAYPATASRRPAAPR